MRAKGTFDLERAGDLLEGIDPRCSPEMDTWLLVSRQRVAGLIDALVRAEVLGSLSAGATARALPLAELGVRRAVFDEGTHVLLVKSLVAAGRYDAYWATSTKPWDIAAGVLLVREAGGIVTAPDGGPLDLAAAQFIATANEPLHAAMRQLLSPERI